MANAPTAITLAGGAIILFALAGVLIAPAFRWIPRGGCENCGYVLEGVREPRCPECGWNSARTPRNADDPSREQG